MKKRVKNIYIYDTLLFILPKCDLAWSKAKEEDCIEKDFLEVFEDVSM